MIITRKDLQFYLKEDAKANRMDGCSVLKYWLRLFSGSESAHVYKYLSVLRCCEYHCNNGGLIHKVLYALYKLRLHRLGFRYNLRIPENICGYGLAIIHLAGGGCLVNAKSIGNYCKLQCGVVIGNTHQSELEKPCIGDYVVFGPGAKVFGDIVVGDHSLIASNAVVTKSVPAYSLVGGVPAVVVKTLS